MYKQVVNNWNDQSYMYDRVDRWSEDLQMQIDDIMFYGNLIDSYECTMYMYMVSSNKKVYLQLCNEGPLPSTKFVWYICMWLVENAHCPKCLDQPEDMHMFTWINKKLTIQMAVESCNILIFYVYDFYILVEHFKVMFAFGCSCR